MPAIINTFSLSLCQHFHLVPFLPLNKKAIEKIIRLKLKILGKQLNARYEVELGYAPEVIRYLTNEVLIKWDSSHQSINPSKALKQLYFCIEQTILNQSNDKNFSNQLFLQLNETGTLLRCDWLPPIANLS
jgi:ATP-dependent Clp protease ATP-binding subunit ClpA